MSRTLRRLEPSKERKRGIRMKTLGFLGVDQHGRTYKIGRYPRKELLEELGRSRADKMGPDGPVHKGYVIGDLWISVYRICLWKEGE